MTLFSATLATLIITAIICIIILFTVPTYALDDKEVAFILAVLVAAGVSAGILGYKWDDILVSRADQFMLTRDAAYTCADRGPSSCKKSILEWQKDSAWFANEVSDILKNIKETK